MPNLTIRETFVNLTRGYRFSETDWQETFTGNRGELFRSLQKDYGRASSMYMDKRDGTVVQVGWVFTKKMQYEDARSDWPKESREYVREVWVYILQKEDQCGECGRPVAAKPVGDAEECRC